MSIFYFDFSPIIISSANPTRHLDNYMKKIYEIIFQLLSRNRKKKHRIVSLKTLRRNCNRATEQKHILNINCLGIGYFCSKFFFLIVCETSLVPSEHTTLFQRLSDVHNVQMTLNRRQKNVLCLTAL